MHAAHELAPRPIENPEVLRRPIRVRVISQREDIAADALNQPSGRIVVAAGNCDIAGADEDGRTGSLRNRLLWRGTWNRRRPAWRRPGGRLVALREQHT